MSSTSRFIAAAAAALLVSAGSVGFLAARRGHTPAPDPAPIAAAEPTPAAAPSPEPTPAVEPEVAPSPTPAVTPERALTRVATPKPAAGVAAKAPSPKAAPTRTARAETPASRPDADRNATTAEVTRPSAPPAAQPAIERPSVPAPTTRPAVESSPAPPQPAVAETAKVEAPKPRFEEYVLKADSVVGIRIDQPLSSATAKLEDRVTAVVSRDVDVDGRAVVPIGSKLEGNVVLVQPGSKFKGRARLGVRFHTLVLANGLRVPFQTEALYRDGDSATKSTATKVGAGAAAGAVLGAVLGGKRGAILGASVGAGGGTAAVLAGDAKEAEIPAGTQLTAKITSPVTLTIERD